MQFKVSIANYSRESYILWPKRMFQRKSSNFPLPNKIFYFSAEIALELS